MDIKDIWAKMREIFEPLINEQRASYPWSKCISDQMKQYGSRETAEKVCGAIKKKYGGRADTEDILLPDDFDLMAALKEIEAELGIQPAGMGMGMELTPDEIKAIDSLAAAVASGSVPFDSLPVPPIQEAGHDYHTAKMEQCLLHLKDQGADTEKAHRICYAALGESANRAVILPTQTRAFTVTRAADGKARWLGVAASAVVNRVGAIDSTALFDSFIKSARDTGAYPGLDFLHEEDRVRFGQADWLWREGALYLASGTFDDTEIARAAIAGLEASPGYWGMSIAYRPTEEPMALVAEGEIPVYTRGINTFISIVPQRMAANLFTSVGVSKEVSRMTPEGLQELVKLVGEEKARPYAELVDEANRTITETGMVMRAEPAPTTQAEPAEPPPAPVETPAAEPPAPEKERQESSAVEERIKELTERIDKLEKLIAGQDDKEKRSTDALGGLDTRLQEVEKNSRAWSDWLAGLPEQKRNDATYRPRDNGDGNAPMSSDQVVAQTMEKINARHKR